MPLFEPASVRRIRHLYFVQVSLGVLRVLRGSRIGMNALQIAARFCAGLYTVIRFGTTENTESTEIKVNCKRGISRTGFPQEIRGRASRSPNQYSFVQSIVYIFFRYFSVSSVLSVVQDLA